MKMEISSKIFNKEEKLVNGDDIVIAYDNWSHLIYKNGNFAYTQSTDASKVFVATASCTKF